MASSASPQNGIVHDLIPCHTPGRSCNVKESSTRNVRALVGQSIITPRDRPASSPCAGIPDVSLATLAQHSFCESEAETTSTRVPSESWSQQCSSDPGSPCSGSWRKETSPSHRGEVPTETGELQPLGRAACPEDKVQSAAGEYSEEPRLGSKNKARFDMLRIREWFNQMDADRCGHVTRKQWMDFMRKHPGLGHLFIEEGFKLSLRAQKNAEAKYIRLMLKSWQKIDTDQNGTLEWDEFVDFFRESGHLLEYKTKDNPKDRMADILIRLHEQPQDQRAEELDEFQDLKKQHLQGERRRSLGKAEAVTALTNLHGDTDHAEDNGQLHSPNFQRRRQSLGRIAANTAKQSTAVHRSQSMERGLVATAQKEQLANQNQDRRQSL